MLVVDVTRRRLEPVGNERNEVSLRSFWQIILSWDTLAHVVFSLHAPHGAGLSVVALNMKVCVCVSVCSCVR